MDFYFLKKVDSHDVWSPPHPQDVSSSSTPSSAEKKPSHFWQSAPVSDWSKEQVSGCGEVFILHEYCNGVCVYPIT